MPASSLPKTGGGADSGAAAQTNYERDRLMQERKRLENQFNSEVTAQNALIDNLGKRKYVLEQQLSVAPAYRQQAIRDELMVLNGQINQVVTGTRARVTEFRTIFEKIDQEIRTGDKNRAIMSGALPTAPEGYTPGALPTEKTAAPDYLGSGASTPVPVPDSLGMAPEAAAPQAPPAGTPAAPPAPVDPNSRTYIAALTPAQFEAMPKEQQDAVLAAVNRERQANRDRANLLTSGAVAYDFLIGAPSNVATWVLNWTTDAIDLPRYARAVGLGDVTSTQIPMQGPTGEFTTAPATDWVKTLRANSAPLTREQFLENLKANEQQASVQEGKGNLQTAPAVALGLAPATTPEGAVAAQPTLPATADVAIGDPADPRVAAIMKYSADAIAARAKDLPARLGAAVASDQGQAIIKRAKALGVDPAAAMAIYGIESSFGKNARRSGAGAKGPMQVTTAQLTNLRTWFNDPRNIRQYGITPELIQVAKSMEQGSIDAGLMQLKYNELIGLEKNLWGAGYQGNANDVLKAGAPLPVHDAGKTGTAGLTNSDYNKLYIELYNEARQYVNIPPRTSSDITGVVGQSQTIRAIDAQQEQIISDYQFVLTTLDAERKANLAKRQEIERQVQIAQEFGDRVAYDQAITNLETLAGVDRDINLKLRTAETEARITYDKLNLARTDEYIKMAVMALDAKNTKPFSQMVSEGLGMLIEITPIEGGKFAVHQNKELISGKGYTLEQVKDRYLAPIDRAYAAQRDEIAKEERKFNSEQLAEDLKLGRDITLEQAKATVEQDGWVESKDAVVDPNTGQVTERMFSKTGPDGKLRVVRMRIAPDREENGLLIKGGVEVEEVTKAGVRQ